MNDEPTPHKLRWFQLGLRDILWLMVVCSTLLGWWLDRRRMQETLSASAKDAEERRAAEVEELQAEVVVAYDNLAQFVGERPRPNLMWPSGSPPARINLEVPRVDGFVVATHKDEATVEIDIGADHGLKTGDVLDAFRVGNTLATTRYLGQIRLMSTDKKSAVGAILPNARGTIEEGDHVAVRVK